MTKRELVGQLRMHAITQDASPSSVMKMTDDEILAEFNPPGGSDPIHKHNAHAFVYVLEGSIVMGVKGGNPVTCIRARRGMKALTTFTQSAETQVKRSRQSFSSC